MLVNDKKIKKSSYFFIPNLILCFICFLTFFLFVIVSKIGNNFKVENNNYHIVLNSKFGYSDKGFSQQAVEGVCASFDVSDEKCNGSDSHFKNNQINYGFPGTMENSVLISRYVDNFIKLEKTNNFVLPGYSYSCFLFDQVKNYLNNEEEDINFISIDATLDGCSNITPAKYQKAYPEWPENLYQINFKHYLAGYHAALYTGIFALQNPELFEDFDPFTPGHQVGIKILGGDWVDPIKRYSLGFKYGIDVVNKYKNDFVKNTNVELLISDYETIGGFSPVEFGDTARIQARKFYLQKGSIIFNVAVSLTKNVHIAALEIDEAENNRKHWVIGVDVDQAVTILNVDSQKSPEEIKNEIKTRKEKIKNENNKILVSAVINIKKAVENIIKQEINNNIKAKKSYNFFEDEFASIPERFKKTTAWKTLLSNKPELINNLNLNQMVIDFDKIIPSLSEYHNEWFETAETNLKEISYYFK